MGTPRGKLNRTGAFRSGHIKGPSSGAHSPAGRTNKAQARRLSFIKLDPEEGASGRKWENVYVPATNENSKRKRRSVTEEWRVKIYDKGLKKRSYRTHSH